MSRGGGKPGWAAWIPMILVLAGCTTPSLDMSNGRIEPPGPIEGVVIGSILVQADQEPPQSWVNSLFGRKSAGFTYVFDIIYIGMSDPNGSYPYAERYQLEAKPGEERIFAARLPTGNYLFRTFHHEGLSAMGGELGLIFTVGPGATHYVGRLHLEVPRRATMGAPFTYKVEDGREATLAALGHRHPDLGAHAINVLMHSR